MKVAILRRQSLLDGRMSSPVNAQRSTAEGRSVRSLRLMCKCMSGLPRVYCGAHPVVIGRKLGETHGHVKLRKRVGCLAETRVVLEQLSSEA